MNLDMKFRHMFYPILRFCLFMTLFAYASFEKQGVAGHIRNGKRLIYSASTV
jgi:hypothetical protein